MAFPWRTPDVVGRSGCLIHVREKLGVWILYLANFLNAWRLATQMRASGEIAWVFSLSSLGPVLQAFVSPLVQSPKVLSPEP